jgi:hypothetical protein
MQYLKAACGFPVLSLWSLLFASLMQPAEAVDGALVWQTAKARS